jgi:hypothetical protein
VDICFSFLTYAELLPKLYQSRRRIQRGKKERKMYFAI